MKEIIITKVKKKKPIIEVIKDDSFNSSFLILANLEKNSPIIITSILELTKEVIKRGKLITRVVKSSFLAFLFWYLLV